MALRSLAQDPPIKPAGFPAQYGPTVTAQREPVDLLDVGQAIRVARPTDAAIGRTEDTGVRGDQELLVMNADVVGTLILNQRPAREPLLSAVPVLPNTALLQTRQHAAL